MREVENSLPAVLIPSSDLSETKLLTDKIIRWGKAHDKRCWCIWELRALWIWGNINLLSTTCPITIFSQFVTCFYPVGYFLPTYKLYILENLEYKNKTPKVSTSKIHIKILKRIQEICKN